MQKLSIEELFNDMSALNNELINAQRELEKKRIEIELLNSELKKSNNNLEQFTSIVSHNLRSPVANIIGIASLLKGETTNEEKDEYLELMFDAVERLNIQIEDLNEILHIKSKVNDQIEELHFSTLVQTIESSIAMLLKKECVQIITDFSKIEYIKSNKNYIYSMFYNMITNSIKYKSPERNPIINIFSEIDKNTLKIHFKDNGQGIDLVKNGDKLFGLYNRFDHNQEGKGLGLFMVKTQIESLGGKISANSVLGQGTEFIIEFPFL